MKIGDHQTVYFSIETEKECRALENYNYKFRRANFDVMHDKLVILDRLIEWIDAAQGFEILKNRVNDASSRHIPRKRITINDLLLLLLKNVGSARLRESGVHPISPKTTAPQYQPIDRKKRKGKRVEDYSRDRAT